MTNRGKHNIFHGQFICRKGGDNPVLVPATEATKFKYKMFLDTMEDGQKAEIFIESNSDTGTVPQIAKIHACIRELSKEMGYSFEDMKLEVKKMSGLCVEKNINGERYLVCKSFGDASIDELGLVIQTIIELGDDFNINFR
jgi:hypothetical protein